MGCPECQCEEIGVSGDCLWCGYQAVTLEEETERPAAARALRSVPMLKAVPASEPSARFGGASFPGEDIFRAALSARYDKDPALLSARSLSGCIDMGIVTLGTCLFVLAAFGLSAGQSFVRGSMGHYSFLFLLVYFLYSLYFQGTSNQTIGMMIMGLRVAAAGNEARPTSLQVFGRSCLYLVSLCCAGAGLIWACFDREHRCLHDRLTHTHIVWK